MHLSWSSDSKVQIDFDVSEEQDVIRLKHQNIDTNCYCIFIFMCFYKCLTFLLCFLSRLEAYTLNSSRTPLDVGRRLLQHPFSCSTTFDQKSRRDGKIVSPPSHFPASSSRPHTAQSKYS